MTEPKIDGKYCDWACRFWDKSSRLNCTKYDCSNETVRLDPTPMFTHHRNLRCDECLGEFGLLEIFKDVSR